MDEGDTCGTETRRFMDVDFWTWFSELRTFKERIELITFVMRRCSGRLTKNELYFHMYSVFDLFVLLG